MGYGIEEWRPGIAIGLPPYLVGNGVGRFVTLVGFALLALLGTLA